MMTWSVSLNFLSRNDPAFSSDPRSHPHHALSFKSTPPSLFPPSLSPPPSPPLPPPAKRPLQSNRKARMKAFVRRLTSPRNLDRIDELDETDPFGGAYHHDGPYEAIASNVAPRVNNLEPGLDPRSMLPGQLHSTTRARGETTGLSLHLEPGQILQQDTIYGPHVSTLVPLSSRPHPTVVRLDHFRTQSIPNSWTRDASSLGSPDDPINRPSSLHAPRERHFGYDTPDIPNGLSPRRDPDIAPTIPRRTEAPIVPPPRYESRLHSSSQHDTPPAFSSVSQITHITTIQPASRIPDKPSEYRVRHLPKRLVMPTPLQPQPTQLQRGITPAARQDERPDEHDLVGGKPAMYMQEAKVVPKRSSPFPAKERIPEHIPTSQDNAVPIIGRHSMKMATETVETKRQRKLSKRRKDV